MWVLPWPFTRSRSKVERGSGNIWQDFVLIAKAFEVSCSGCIWTAVSPGCWASGETNSWWAAQFPSTWSAGRVCLILVLPLASGMETGPQHVCVLEKMSVQRSSVNLSELSLGLNMALTPRGASRPEWGGFWEEAGGRQGRGVPTAGKLSHLASLCTFGKLTFTDTFFGSGVVAGCFLNVHN